MPDQELQVEVAGDHDQSGEEPFASENMKVDFHVKSALASDSALLCGEMVLPHVHTNSMNKIRR
jgi:hypothetical protein